MYLTEAGRRRGHRRGQHSVPEVAFGDTRLSVWEERDRAHVELINTKNDATIVEWWDDEVRQAIEDGFLKPGQLHATAYDYAVHIGLIRRPGTKRARENPVQARDYDSADDALTRVRSFLGAEWYTRNGDRIVVYVPMSAHGATADEYGVYSLIKAEGLYHWSDKPMQTVKSLPKNVQRIPGGTSEARECACEHCMAKENPVDMSDGIPWVTTERNVEDFEEIRVVAEKVGPIKGSKDIYNLMSPWTSRQDQEHLCVILVDIHSMLRGVAMVHKGMRDRVAVDPQDVLKPAIDRGAKGLAILHNHPSGSAQHSKADASLTKAIEKACKASGIAFLDHVVAGSGEYYSFADKKLHRVRGRGRVS